MKTKIHLLAAGALLALGLPLAASAQTQQNVTVSVTVNGSCSLSSPVNAIFASQAPLNAVNLVTTGSVTLRCNAKAAPVLTVGDGNNFSGTRRMAGSTNFVAYSVKQPTISGTDFTVCPAFNSGTDWDTGSPLNASDAFSSSGGSRTVNLCFQTTVDENTPIATYTDTVLVSVAF
jgi:spore coat protein U-like protein